MAKTIEERARARSKNPWYEYRFLFETKITHRMSEHNIRKNEIIYGKLLSVTELKHTDD